MSPEERKNFKEIFYFVNFLSHVIAAWNFYLSEAYASWKMT